jgi:ABC-2 type transport system permease protein
VMAVYLLSSAAVGSVQAVAQHQGHQDVAKWAGLFTPFDLVDGVQSWALRERPTTLGPPGGLGGPVFTVVCAALIAGSVLLLFVRFRKAGSR